MRVALPLGHFIPLNKSLSSGNHETDVPYSKLLDRIAEFKGTWLNANMPGFELKLPAYSVRRLAGDDGSPFSRLVAFAGRKERDRHFEIAI